MLYIIYSILHILPKCEIDDLDIIKHEQLNLEKNSINSDKRYSNV